MVREREGCRPIPTRMPAAPVTAIIFCVLGPVPKRYEELPFLARDQRRSVLWATGRLHVPIKVGEREVVTVPQLSDAERGRRAVHGGRGGPAGSQSVSTPAGAVWGAPRVQVVLGAHEARPSCSQVGDLEPAHCESGELDGRAQRLHHQRVELALRRRNQGSTVGTVCRTLV